jgi:hypothetical protein
MVEILVMRLFKPMPDAVQISLHQPVLGQSVWGALGQLLIPPKYMVHVYNSFKIKHL